MHTCVRLLSRIPSSFFFFYFPELFCRFGTGCIADRITKHVDTHAYVSLSFENQFLIGLIVLFIFGFSLFRYYLFVFFFSLTPYFFRATLSSRDERKGKQKKKNSLWSRVTAFWKSDEKGKREVERGGFGSEVGSGSGSKSPTDIVQFIQNKFWRTNRRYPLKSDWISIRNRIAYVMTLYRKGRRRNGNVDLNVGKFERATE